MSKPEGPEKVEAKTVGNNGSDVGNQGNPENNDRLQRLYLRRLQEFAVRISGFLYDPVDAFDKFAFQRIAALSTQKDKKRQMIQSSPMLSHQIHTFFSQVLLQTNFQEIRKVEWALVYYNEDKNQDEIHAIFGVIADELNNEATETIEFHPPRVEGISNDSSAKSNGGLTPTPSTSRPGIDLRSKLHKAIIISGTAEGLVNFLRTPAVNNKGVWLTQEKDTPLHSAARSPNTIWAKEATQIIMDSIDKDPSQFPLERQELLNFQNKQKNTALHLAVENQSCQLAQCLLDQGADFLVRNNEGLTPLELMYKKTPEVVLHVLKTAIRPGGKFANDENLELNIDFRALVGGSSKIMKAANALQNNNNFHVKSSSSEESSNDAVADEGDGRTTCIPIEERRALNTLEDTSEQEDASPGPNLEMDLLAKMVYQNYNSSAPLILSNVTVKTFLELKWKKLRKPISFLTFFYIIMYFGFNLFAIWTFIIKFPCVILENNGTLSEESASVYENLTFWNYLWGIWLQPATGCSAGDARADGADKGLAAIPMLLGIISWLVELCEFYLINKLTTVTGKCQAGDARVDRTGRGLAAVPMLRRIISWCVEFYEFYLIKKLATVRQALRSYCSSLENILQMFFGIGAIVIAFVGFLSDYRLHYWTYWLTALLVVVSWTLILLQLGNFPRLGKYVQIFKTVTKKFTIVMSIYIWFLVGFSIAFSIIFPQDRFSTLPTSFFRSISMMAGELNFDEVFDQEKVRPFPFITQAVYLGFTVLVTIILINLLTGLAVDDIGKILGDSDVIHRSIQVERLYVLERMLYKWKIFSDIYVLPHEENRKRKDRSIATRQTRISDLSRELRQELRLAYAQTGENMMRKLLGNSNEDSRSAQESFA